MTHILLTNDDGIHAEGLRALESIARQLSDNISIVAPETEQSGASHSISVHAPLRIKHYAEARYSVTGTPTDCVLLATKHILTTPASLVLSGVNRGSNVGDDVTYSGTVAGAMEACVLGIPSVALSQLYHDDNEVYDAALAHGARVITTLLTMPLPAGRFWNVNFPATNASDVKGVRVTHQGKRVMNIAHHARKDPKGRPYFWIGGERDNTADSGSDVDLLQQGYITVTPLNIDITDYASLKHAQSLF